MSVVHNHVLIVEHGERTDRYVVTSGEPRYAESPSGCPLCASTAEARAVLVFVSPPKPIHEDVLIEQVKHPLDRPRTIADGMVIRRDP